jgi:hypothetical protein
MATNTYVALDETTVSGTSTATITFASIPSTYTDLVIVGNLGSETTNAFPYLQFNGDTGSNYSYTELFGTGSSALSSRSSNNTQLFNSNVSVKQGAINSNVVYHIMNYANTTTYKTSLSRQSTVDAADYNGSLAAVGLWRGSTGSSTEAITSVSIKLTRGGTPYNFSDGSTFSLYGIAAEGVSPAAKATGGAIYSDADYYYHVFGASGTFTPVSTLSCDVLVVAGGAGGGAGGGGGGGAGAFRTFTTQAFPIASYSVTIGAGGAAQTGSNQRGNAGVDSTVNSLTSVGGGGGGAYATNNGITGGSGGGAGSDGTTGTGGAGQTGGNNGGNVTANVNLAGGGGGGAGAVGAANSGTTGGAGGIGSSTAISGGSTTGLGQLSGGVYYFAGGGGGGVNSGAGPAGAGGLGGGGAGGLNAVGRASGTANTGGGGGGSTNTLGTAGGSGIIIIRYLKA